MNKKAYLQALEHELKANKVDDIDEIIAEYAQHFDFKTADGYSEEEIAARLEKPCVIAEQFISPGGGGKDKKSKVILSVGLFFADIAVAVFFIVLFGWIISLGAFSIASAGSGFELITGLNVTGLIPAMPYLPGLVAGISCIGLAVLAAIGTIYCYLYVVQLIRAYFRWHGNTLLNGSSGYPPLSKHPKLNGAFRRRLRSVSLFALAAFGFCFIAGMIMLFAAADFKPFWHEWNWFI